MDIIYQNNNFVICLKPAGIISQHCGDGKGLADILRQELGCEIFPVHRLDSAVSGVIVFAKNRETAANLSGDKLNKTYIAVVEGIIPEKDGELFDLLFHDRTENKAYPVKRKRRGVREARLEYSVLQESEGFSLVRVHPITGRTHQIRVQFSSRKNPVAGDGKYGSRTKCPIALFCASLSFSLDEKEYSFTQAPDHNTFPWSLFTPERLKTVS